MTDHDHDSTTAERLARIRKRAERDILNTGLPKVYEHGVDVLNLLDEVQILHGGLKRVLQIRTARNIVNQLADYYSVLIPSEQWVRVRQMSNDRLDTFVQSLIAEKVADHDA